MVDVNSAYNKIITETKETANHLKFKKILTFALSNYTLKAKQLIINFVQEFDIISKLEKEDQSDPRKEVCRVDSISSLVQMAEDMTLREFLDSCRLDNSEKDVSDNAVVLSTCHAAKGLEWPTVFVLGCSDEVLPHSMVYKDIQAKYGDISKKEMEATQEYQQEVNTMYVAQTRAEKTLVLLHTKQQSDYTGKPKEFSLSPIVARCLPTLEKEGKVFRC